MAPTTAPGDAERLARSRGVEAWDRVIAAGGDGTLNEVANGLAALDAPPPLGFLPLGTANVMAEEIGLPRRPEALASVLLGGTVRSIGLGMAGERLFLLMVGDRLDAHVVEAVHLAAKRRFGKAAYAWTTLKQIFAFGFPQYRLRVDGEERQAATVIVSRARCYAGPFVLAPEAELEGSGLIVTLFSRAGRLAAIGYTLALVGGWLPRLTGVTQHKAECLDLLGPEGEPLQGDGDFLAHLPISIRASDKTLPLIFPS